MCVCACNVCSYNCVCKIYFISYHFFLSRDTAVLTHSLFKGDLVRNISIHCFIHSETRIGFEFPNYTFQELDTNSPQTIRLVKETNSDLTVSVVISILAQTPPNSVVADTNDYSLITSLVYEFSPEDITEDITFTVLADESVERLEGVVLSVNRADGSPLVLQGSNPTTNVFISDSDGKL